MLVYYGDFMAQKVKTSKAKTASVSGTEAGAVSAKTEKVESDFNPYSHIDAALDVVEKRLNLTSMAFDKNEQRFSTGLLSLDLMLAGGLLGGGWYTVAGGEQSCKTTLAVTILASIVNNLEFAGKPSYWDYESSLVPDYVENIFKSFRLKIKLDNVFGIMNEHTGDWVVPPIVRRYAPDCGESFFDYLAALQKALPDKIFVKGNWWYVYENTKANAAIVKGKYNKELFSKHNKFYVPAKDGTIQAILLCDSYATMAPRVQDEQEESGSDIALQARMFSKELRRVKSKMRRKRIVVLGINQLRKKPMVMFGPTEDETGGESLKFNCLRKDMLCFTDKGLLTVEDMNLRKPQSMLALKGEENINAFDYMGHAVTSTVITESGYFVAGKRTHKVLALYEGSSKPKWVSLEGITDKHYLPVKLGGDVWSQTVPEFDFTFAQKLGQGQHVDITPTLPTKMSEELAELCGMLTADGCMYGNGYLNFVNSDKIKVLRVKKLILDLFDLEAKVEKNESVYSLLLSSTVLESYLRYLGIYGKSARDKEVPWCVKEAPRNIVVAYLAGLFSCDSHEQDREFKFSFNPSSGKLAHVVHLMLLNLGVYATFTNVKEKFFHFRDDTDPTSCGAMVSVQGVEMLEKLYSVIPISPDKIAKGVASLEKYYAGEMRQLKQDACYTLPKMVGWRQKGTRFWTWVYHKLALNGKQQPSLYDVTESLVSEFETYVSTLRTSSQREANLKDMDIALKFLKLTESNNLVWVKVSNVVHSSIPVATYDANMPITHTTVANGIVSHNSDVRLRSSSVVPPAGVTRVDGYYEEEPSAVYEGKDRYRYIKIKTHKNKLGGMPNQELILRLRVSDALGRGTGFCHTFDTFTYLKNTGQIKGSRKKFTFVEGYTIKRLNTETGKSKEEYVEFDKKLAGLTLNWQQLKVLVEGTKQQIKELCESLKLKPFFLRDFLAAQVSSGVGYQYSLDAQQLLAAKTNAKASNEDDDE